jgi:hypothetical protein
MFVVDLQNCWYLRLYNVECQDGLNDLERMQRQEVVDWFEVLYQNLPGVTDEIHEKY